MRLQFPHLALEHIFYMVAKHFYFGEDSRNAGQDPTQ